MGGSLELHCLTIEVTQRSEEFPQFDFNAFLQSEDIQSRVLGAQFFFGGLGNVRAGQ